MVLRKKQRKNRKKPADRGQAPERKHETETHMASGSFTPHQHAAGGFAGRSATSECTRPTSPMSPASDVYSLGVCIAEIHGGFSTAMERAAVISALKRAAARPVAASPEAASAPGTCGREVVPLLPS